MATQQPRQSQWTPLWSAVVALVAGVAVVLAMRSHLLPFAWWGLPVLALAGAVAAVLASCAQEARMREAVKGWGRVHVFRATGCLTAGWLVTWATLVGFTPTVCLLAAASAATLAGLSYWCRPPHVGERGSLPVMRDDRPEDVRAWERLLQHLTKSPVRVTQVQPWDNPADGFRVVVDLPMDGSVTADRVDAVRPGIAVALRQRPGCTVRVLDGEHQGQVVLDVMRRDCLADEVVVAEDFTPASILDEFEVATTPRGEPLSVCLRSQSMVVGGAPDSGKTTLLHRIILFLARCVNALVWIVDTNGGGVAEPWVRPWALGRASRPIVDWVAQDEDEAAVLVAVAAAIAKDRKSAPEATRRKHDANTIVLPVDAKLPAIVMLNDEGGEVRQAVSLLGQLADQGLTRLAQIGRAEGVRVVKSVLRGTSDLLDKSMRVCAALRICLRMEEEGEYVHVLGTEPGRTALLHNGTGYVKRPRDPRPIFARTVNVRLDAIERAAVACAGLRPELDERAQRVAARVRPAHVLGGREPSREMLALPVMRDVAAGRAYSGRWERCAGWLAAMRGEESAADGVDGPDVPVPSPAPQVGGPLGDLLAATGIEPTPSGPPVSGDDGGGGYASSRSAAAALAAALVEAGVDLSSLAYLGDPSRTVDFDDQEEVDRQARELLADIGTPRLTTREHILAILHAAYPEVLTSSQIGDELAGRGAAVGRTYRQDVLRDMTAADCITHGPDGYQAKVPR